MNTKLLSFASVVLSLSLAPTAFGAGFEKSIPWGGETSGLAGIGTPQIEGSQALFFNPAGLLSDKKGHDATFNLSVTKPTTKAPMFNTYPQITSESKTLFPVSLLFGNTLNDKVGYGAGVYVAGGLATDFKNASLPFGTRNLKSELTITEVALGVGYKVMDNLKVGASWRAGMASADFAATYITAGQAFAQYAYTGMKGNNYFGLKLGAQYKVDENTHIGLTYRSQMTYDTKGDYNSGATAQDGKVTAMLPAAWTLGAMHRLTSHWNLYGEYAFTEYSKIENLELEHGGTKAPLQVDWKDQQNLRLAASYTGFNMPIRFGYMWTSQVTNSDYALPTTTPPGAASTFTVGTGHKFGDWKVDGGFDYTSVSGKRTGYTNENEVTSYALHLGTTYSF